MSNSFVIRFDGLDASDHMLDMRRLGESLVGLDRVVNVGMLSLANHRLPKRGERFPLVVRAQAPHEGSVEIYGDLAPAVAVGLPLVHEMFNTAAGELAWRWITWVFNMTGGRTQDADPHFVELMELTKEIHKGRAESEAANREFLLEVLREVTPATRSAVSAVGRSANTVAFRGGEDGSVETVIDVPMADAIRSSEKLEVGDMEQFVVRVDGLIHHGRQLKIEHPDEPNHFISAEVRDPAFSEPDNVYLQAMNVMGRLEVTAKPTRKQDGRLHRLYIMDAKAVPDDDA